MPDELREIDEYGYNRDKDNWRRSSSYDSDNSYRSYSRSSSRDRRRRSRSRSSSRSRSRSRRHSRHRDWIVPTNPLLRSGDSHRHHRHRHHHHRRHRSRSPKRLTVADKKERWGHELYIENVILNPEPEPPRIEGDWEPPKEKWISKAGGVAIFTSKPTSASSYQGRNSN